MKRKRAFSSWDSESFQFPLCMAFAILSYYLPDVPVAVGCERVAPTEGRRAGEVLIDISSVPRSTMGAVSVTITG